MPDNGNFQTLRVGMANSYSKINEYGEFRMVGDGVVWNDLVIPLTQTKQGATTKPDFDFTNVGFLFPQNDATEILYGIVQLPHWWKAGSTIYPHVHWQQAADAAAVFKLDYKWFNIGAAVPAGFTTATMGTYVNTYVSGNLHQISKTTAGIDGTGKTISSIILFKLYRNDNVYTGDLLAWQLDFHLATDAIGSESEYAKA